MIIRLFSFYSGSLSWIDLSDNSKHTQSITSGKTSSSYILIGNTVYFFKNNVITRFNLDTKQWLEDISHIYTGIDGEPILYNDNIVYLFESNGKIHAFNITDNAFTQLETTHSLGSGYTGLAYGSSVLLIGNSSSNKIYEYVPTGLAYRYKVSVREDELSALSNRVTIAESDIDNLETDVSAIEEKIPTEASSSNKLADKTYVATQLGGYYTKGETDTALGGKQATLESGTNIKTIQGQSVLGSGDIDFAMTAAEYADAISVFD